MKYIIDMKKLSKKKEFWELILPEPFAIDPVLKNEDLINTMANFDNVDEMNNFLFECLAYSDNKIILYLSEYEVFNKLFSLNDNNLNIRLVKDKSRYAVVVEDNNRIVLGKGELCKLGDKHSLESTQEILNISTSSFKERYNKEMNKINSLVVQAQQLKKDILKVEETQENN